MTHSALSRRLFAKYSGLSLLGTSASGWLPALAGRVQQDGLRPPKACILLWMSGGPSQMETLDPKEGHENGGPTKAIDTVVPGIRIADNLPRLATQMQDVAIVRSMATKEGDHARATYYLRTGYLPQGPIQYPSIGAFLSKELKSDHCDLPACVSINPFRAFSPGAFGPGFLGPAWSPLVVASQMSQDDDVSFEVRNLKTPESVSAPQLDARLRLLSRLEDGFLSGRPGSPGTSHLQSYEQAVRMMRSSAVEAFNLDSEDTALRDAYGRNPFGQGCLLARRLVEQGVAFVEVALNGVDVTGGAGWDTHADNFESVSALCEILDPGWATLIEDLRQRGLLEHTLVVWMGEFGRTPQINENSGRDHWPGSWSMAMAGAGVRGGQTWGATAEDGVEIVDNPLSVPNLMATICQALQLDHMTTNLSNIGRPIPLADHGASPVAELLA